MNRYLASSCGFLGTRRASCFSSVKKWTIQQYILPWIGIVASRNKDRGGE